MGEPPAPARGARRAAAVRARPRATTARTRRRADTKQETREALIAAARAEFAMHGLDGPSLDAICARAGYTRGAFYVHFRDRTDLLAAVVQQATGAFLDTVIASGDEAHDLARTVGRFADAVTRTMGAPAPRRGAAARRKQDTCAPPLGGALPVGVPFACLLEAVSRNPPMRAGFTALLERARARLAAIVAGGQQAGTTRADVDPAQAGMLLAMIALGALVAVDLGLGLDPAGVRRTLLALLAPPPSPRRIRRPRADL